MGKTAVAALVLAALVGAAACDPVPTDPGGDGSATSTSTSTSTESSATTAASTTPTTGATSSEIDLTALPLGDGKVATEPTVGSVYSCQTTFGGGGAFAVGEWIDEAAGTWDLTAKTVTVDGEVSWPSDLTVTVESDTRVVATNGLPDEPTGTFPVAADDDAYAYDRNPNSIVARQVVLELPADPQVDEVASCTSLGAIGVTTTGAVLFNGLDGRGEDAVAHEIQDECGGHPERTGQYHYHSISECVEGTAPATEDATEPAAGHAELVGWALDGFGIYGHTGEDGEVLTNADLDECHGHTHTVTWDGEEVEMYHYHATYEYPYTVGCFRGTPT